MNTNENTRSNAPDDIIDLGIASVETKGNPPATNEGVGFRTMPGITE